MHTEINEISQHPEIVLELHKIRLFIEQELRAKQEIIRQKDKQIEELKNIVARRETETAAIDTKARELALELDGNRQLINKLIGDISKLHNDIEWYNRTYEKRSFMGVIKEKLFKKKP